MTTTNEVAPDPFDEMEVGLGGINAWLGRAEEGLVAARQMREANAQILADVREELGAETAAHALTRTELTAALKRIRELESAAPVGRLPFGIGINEKPTAHASPLPYTRAALEQLAGVKFAYVHEYFTFPTSGVLTSVVTWCEGHLKAGRIPFPTIKVPGNDWTGTAAGKYDATVDATMDALAALVETYRSTFPLARILVGIQHEPNNDGKPKADFDAMIGHLEPIVRRPGVLELWTNYTGWSQLYGPDNDWRLGDLDTDHVDGVLFDPYLSLGASSKSFTDMVTAYAVPYGKWAKARGIQWGFGETALSENAATSTIAGVKTWWLDLCAGTEANGGTVTFYWNNKVAPSTDRPVTQDWRISATKPADKVGQMVAAMKRWALKVA